LSDDWFLRPCPTPSASHAALAVARQDTLTKPQGSLGTLEALAIKLASLQASERPKADMAPIILFAGDHGVTAQGISAYPAAVTVEMLRNFARGGAAICVLARELGVPLEVVDAGTLGETDIPGVIVDKPAQGTRDFAVGPAMTSEEALFALGAGRRAVERAKASRPDLVILGEMGIGNTTSAAAVAAALLARPPRELVGAGTGLDAAGIAKKANVIAAALALHRLASGSVSPFEALARVGGLEITALTGAIIAAAQAGTPVLIDGFIVSVAALLAVNLNASCGAWLLYSHASQEQGHRFVLEALGGEPILDLKLRLGEGSGAALALPLLRLACALHAQMATFEEASVSRSEPS
jgi:nicotinate-nucleotide--dimethylbenzimidazole phosphoribosyltransferase